MVNKARDKRWSQEIRKRNGGLCPHCNKPGKAGAHHIIAREVQATRYLVINGVNTCEWLHRQFEGTKEERDDAISRFVGWRRYGLLEAIASGLVTNARLEEVE